MSEITVTLNQKYKSFENGFTTTLNGNLILLSGTNGSGKSQLIDIIKGYGKPQNGGRENIRSTVLVDGEALNQKKIEFRSFKDNIDIPEVKKLSSYEAMQSVTQAYNAFTQGILNPSNNPSFSGSCMQANLILDDAYGVVDNSISEEEFKTALLRKGFIWRNEDQFTDYIGGIFYNYASNVAQGQIEAGKRSGPAFDPNTIGIAPWTELNKLFERLGLDYRFKSHYEILHSELNETPFLYPIDESGVIVESDKRVLAHLSDGEKSIISLCFTSLRKIEDEDKKLLLLDELDAVLNPSLTENLFQVIQEYYLDKDIKVILTTHSPATISLAPEITVYYEMFKKNYWTSRIIEVGRDEYKELQRVNKRFYDKIDNQAQRIANLETILESDSDILIITEGKTDWKYILGALKFYHAKNEFKDIKEEFFLKFGSEQDVTDSICGTNRCENLGESELNKMLSGEINRRLGDLPRREKIWIGIFDSDTQTKNKSKPEYNVYSFKIEPDDISTEFLFSDDEIKTDFSGKRLFIGTEFYDRSRRHITENLSMGRDSHKKATKKVIIDCDVYNELNENVTISKEEFSQAIYNHEIEICDESWERFRHIFIKISSLLTPLHGN